MRAAPTEERGASCGPVFSPAESVIRCHRMLRLLRVERVLIGCCLLAAPSARGDSPLCGLEKFGEEDGIAVYRRDVAGTPVVALRGEGVVDAPLLRVASVLVDTKRQTKWIDSLEEARTVRA